LKATDPGSFIAAAYSFSFICIWRDLVYVLAVLFLEEARMNLDLIHTVMGMSHYEVTKGV